MPTGKPPNGAQQVVDLHVGKPTQAYVPLSIGDHCRWRAGDRSPGRIRPKRHWLFSTALLVTRRKLPYVSSLIQLTSTSYVPHRGLPESQSAGSENALSAFDDTLLLKKELFYL